MEGSHLPRGSHQRCSSSSSSSSSSTPWPPYQRGRTTRRNTRTRGLPRVGLRLRDRLAFVVVFVSPKGEGRRERCARVRASRKRDQPRGEQRQTERVDDDVPRPRILSPSAFARVLRFGYYRQLVLSSGSLRVRSSRTPKQRRVFPVSLGKNKSPQTKGRARSVCQTALAWISGRSRDYNGRDNAYYAPQHGRHCRFDPPGNEYCRRTQRDTRRPASSRINRLPRFPFSRSFRAFAAWPNYRPVFTFLR